MLGDSQSNYRVLHFDVCGERIQNANRDLLNP